MYTNSLNMLVMPMSPLFKDNKNGYWERIISRTKALEHDAGWSHGFATFKVLHPTTITKVVLALLAFMD